MTGSTVSCPECDTQQDIETDEYGLFTLECGGCGTRSKGEYTSPSIDVAWRWTQPISES